MKVLLITGLYLVPLLTCAQHVSLSGRIIDGESKEALVACQVYLQDSSWSTVSDHMGYYALWIPEEKVQQVVIEHQAYNPIRLPWTVLARKQQLIALQRKWIGISHVQVADPDHGSEVSTATHWRWPY